MVAPAVEVRQLSKRFGETLALDRVSLSVQPGEFVVLLGASGSGKSTLLRALNGFVLGEPDPESEVRCLGRRIQAAGRPAPDLARSRSRIGFIFQQFQLVRRLPVLTNVLCGVLGQLPLWRAMGRLFTPAQREAAWSALDRVGLSDRAWRRASDLSGGQQQRVAIARALVQGAELVLADEPIASLDPVSGARVMDALQALNRDKGATVLVSLHQVEVARAYARRIVALSHGRIRYDGPPDGLSPALLAEIYGANPEPDHA
jgi:phosphonate transport system ATP-binding protein